MAAFTLICIKQMHFITPTFVACNAFPAVMIFHPPVIIRVLRISLLVVIFGRRANGGVKIVMRRSSSECAHRRLKRSRSQSGGILFGVSDKRANDTACRGSLCSDEAPGRIDLQNTATLIAERLIKITHRFIAGAYRVFDSWRSRRYRSGGCCKRRVTHRISPTPVTDAKKSVNFHSSGIG